MGTKGSRNESSRELSFSGNESPENERARERKFQGKAPSFLSGPDIELSQLVPALYLHLKIKSLFRLKHRFLSSVSRKNDEFQPRTSRKKLPSYGNFK